jgi:hypothetical protein
MESDVYTQHTSDVTVAKYAPSGFYIASAGEVTLNRGHLTQMQMIRAR